MKKYVTKQYAPNFLKDKRLTCNVYVHLGLYIYVCTLEVERNKK